MLALSIIFMILAVMTLVIGFMIKMRKDDEYQRAQDVRLYEKLVALKALTASMVIGKDSAVAYQGGKGNERGHRRDH